MRFLFCGDIVGRAGREVLAAHLPALRKEKKIDFVVVNAENAAHGFGITRKITQELLDLGVDCLTTGNHVWDQREALSFIDHEPRLLRPANYPKGTPGRGAHLYTAANGQKILVVNVMGRLYMESLDDPFATIETILAPYQLGKNVDAILIDFHAEATSEKMAMGHFLDGSVSLVVGTHTHVPTADYHILSRGTAYQSDAGMCGDYDSVIGMEKSLPIQRFLRKLPTEKLQVASGPATLCGLFLETDDQTGLALQVAPVRLGGRLKETPLDF
jgi:2',3'-cyclic-nucleotide 2'-phosphodiesterase